MPNLEDVITDAVNDAQLPEEPVEVADTTTETPTEVAETPSETSVEATETPSEDTSIEVKSPAASQPAEASAEPQDEFEKLAGVAQMGIGGRENRIPYSRVKKITEKAVSAKEAELAETVLGRKLNPGEKAIDVVKQHVARLPELETKVNDYEARLTQVGEFETIMESQPQRFLQMLSQLPAYREFFDFVEQAVSQQGGATQQQVAQQPAVSVDDPMPEPDQELSDGSRVFSMEGLQRLLDWKARQVEQKVTQTIEQRYKPIESEWQERRRIEATLPVVRAKLEEASKWPLFNESEEEITRVLAANPRMSLESAYQHVVFPKFQAEREKLAADRNKLRQELLAELKQAPTSTAVPARATKPNPPAAGPRSLEDIIKDEISKLK